MTIDEFNRCLDVYGADLERWPADQRDAAHGVMATPAGRSALQAARSFEALLENSLPPPPEMGLKARVLGRLAETRLPPAASAGWPAWLTPVRWRPLAAAAVAPLALGFVLGFAWPKEEDGFEDAVSTLAFSSVFEEELAAEGAATEPGPGTNGERDAQ